VRCGVAEILLEELLVRVCELLPMSVQAMRCDARCCLLLRRTFFLWAWISACPLRFDCMDCAQEMSLSGEAS
jgi:hypothetical protein